MSQVLMGFVGDVLVDRDDPQEVFRDVLELLKVPDILFANLESAYTDNPRPVPSALAVVSAPSHNLDVYAKSGFNVVSLANNHILDAGYEAMLETRSRLRSQGIKTCGAGVHRSDAHQPAILECLGVRIAFLAYSSTFPMGYDARVDRPGVAPMRAYNFYREQIPTYLEPGSYPQVMTIPDETDLVHLTEDIEQARSNADLVITSFHWGDYTRPFRLTDHETRTAKYCIDHGADMVIGHHHHALRGMEWYKGKPIMYGLGHFVFDRRFAVPEKEYAKWEAALGIHRTKERDPYYMGPRSGWPLLPMHEDTRMTCLAWATATHEGVSGIGFLPCRLTQDGLVHPLRLDSAEGREVVDYLKRCNVTQGLQGRIESEGSLTMAGFHTLRVVPN